MTTSEACFWRMCIVKASVDKHVNILDNNCGDIMWIALSAEYTQTNKPVCLGLVYISPQNASRHTILNDDIFRTLETQIMIKQNNEYICAVCGDFNGRTGEL
jgi:hypothetical protein